ncbi:copper amine oxidase N-terminal domain-containing protein [Paenibacillus harenae]|uniref:Copper amine oxidase-like N-terminal domain-containing protein n=1 Tax=Paenibacillus harenae TaxID=306543 RepID=A0ABT9TZ30_PAEHA|nr:copper amine oxidase N-terminal domain-containing protein [Paenibacillus harenae]MDQ0112627.1 hypothetical protein [Paenibacillus harenae]
MAKKILLILLFTCLMTSVSVVSAADKQVRLYVNDIEIKTIEPIIKAGVTYVPFRQFFEALGYTVGYNAEAKEVSGRKPGSEIKYWLGEDIVEHNGQGYWFFEVAPFIQGQVYFPLRFIGDIIGYSARYDKQQHTVNLTQFGYGQEQAIRELLTKYYRNFSPKLLTSDNLELGYYNLEFEYDADKPSSEIPVRDFVITINTIDYSAMNEAALHVTYTENTQVMNQKEEFALTIRQEEGMWKIAKSTMMSSTSELPSDINETAKAILVDHYDEQEAVLSDLRTYYKVSNEENYELTYQYTSPLFIDHWNSAMVDPRRTWDDVLRVNFMISDERVKLSKERVVFLGEKEAVVHGFIDWIDLTQDIAEGDIVYEALIYMDYANGHWNYHYEYDLEQGFNDW